MGAITKFDDTSLQAICDIVGDTGDGLTGSEVGRLLALSAIEDVAPRATKKHRLFAALYSKQERDGCSNNVVAFIQRVMDPIRYARSPEVFKQRRSELNFILALRGYELRENGQLCHVQKVDTLTEAEKRARSLRRKLDDRGVHRDVLHFCSAELLEDNYFHAVFEATKSVAEKLRSLTDLETDGAELVDEVFNIKYPLLIINNLRDETERMEQKGFINLLKGVFGTFRNTTAHAPKITWEIKEADALDLLTMTSYAHRKIDIAVRTGLPVRDKS